MFSQKVKQTVAIEDPTSTPPSTPKPAARVAVIANVPKTPPVGFRISLSIYTAPYFGLHRHSGPQLSLPVLGTGQHLDLLV